MVEVLEQERSFKVGYSLKVAVLREWRPSNVKVLRQCSCSEIGGPATVKVPVTVEVLSEWMSSDSGRPRPIEYWQIGGSETAELLKQR